MKRPDWCNSRRGSTPKYWKKHIGEMYNWLIVIDIDWKKDKYRPKKKTATTLCWCLCGELCWIPLYSVKSGKKVSCGCKKRFARTHGLSKTKTYIVWYNMIGRCKYKTHKSYHNYGGRGISVCEEWKDFF